MSNDNRWDVFGIREYTQNGEQKSAFTKIGTAFTNQNGSINVLLDAIPLTGKMQLQVPLSREEREALFNKNGGGQQQRGGQGQRSQPQGQGQGRPPQGNPRNAGQQQRQQAASRYGGGRQASQPQQGSFGDQRPQARQYQPSPQDFGPGPDPGYEPAQAESELGWQVDGVWITDHTKLPTDHPDYSPF